MKKIHLLFVCFFFYSQLCAQTINGKVFDENNLPLYGVSVYFDGTTIGTTTNEDGFFELKMNTVPNATFVISYIGYESVFLNTIQSPIEIKLKASSIALKEVVLEPIPFSRKEMLAVFREQFLGKTKGGKNCVILNEDAIRFSYDSKSFKLSAFADEKLKIKNNYLGYSIEFEMIDFYALYSKRTLSTEFARSSFFAGTSFYQEMIDAEKSFDKNRVSSYLGSTMHFFKNLTEKKWGKEDFVLYERSFPTNADLFFEISDFEQLKKVSIKVKETNSLISIGATKFYKSFSILYRNKEQSKVTFRTPVFYVDAFGNHTNIDQIDFSGEISKKRFGDMLPVNFKLPTQTSAK